MERKSFVKVLVLAGILCLVLGMATGAMAVMSITDIAAQVGQPLVDVDGNVKMKVDLGGVTNGEQLTIKVEDYDAVLANSSEATIIKYIDQVTVSGSGTVSVDIPSFKLKDAVASTSKTYKVTVGGTGVSSVRAEAIYKLSDQTVTFTPVKAWIVGPTVVKAGTAYTYEIKSVDAQGRLGSVTGWTVNSPSVATIDGNIITATFADQGSGTVNISKDGITVTPLSVTVIASNATVVPYISPDSITNAGTGVKLGTNAVVSKLPSGAFIDKTPIQQSSSAITINVPEAPASATNTVKVGLVGSQTTTTVNGGSFTPTVAGKYRMLIETSDGTNVTTKTVFFTVLDSTDYGNLTTRTNLLAGDITVNTTADGKIALRFTRKADNSYDYWILPMTGRLMPNETYQNLTADKDFWTALTVTTDGDVSTFDKPASNKDYRVSIYAKHSATVANVDTYRIITLRINADGSVQRLNPNGNGTWVNVTAIP